MTGADDVRGLGRECGFYAWRGRPLVTPGVRANRVLAAGVCRVALGDRNCFDKAPAESFFRPLLSHVSTKSNQDQGFTFVSFVLAAAADTFEEGSIGID